jgi:hypothetical protein
MGSSDHHEHLRHSPNVEIVNARMIASQAEDWWTAWRQFYFSYRWPEE